MWNQNLNAGESRKRAPISEEERRFMEDSGKPKEVTIDAKSEIENQSGGVDSGFLSGPQLSSCDIENSDSEDDTKEKKLNKLEEQSVLRDSDKEYTDSGCLEDIEKDKSGKSGHMIVDSGIVDSGLSEWFCNLSLKNSNQALNNLGSSDDNKKRPSETVSAPNVYQSREDRDRLPWEIYYHQNDDGDTQLHLACITGYVEVVAALIRLAPHPCLLDIQNDEVQTALHLAVLVGQPKIVRMLLVAGAKATVRDKNGNTPLHLACMSGDLECVEALTIPISALEMQDECRTHTSKWEKLAYSRCAQLPPDLELRNYDGERCVHLAAQRNHIEILRHLVRFGADINAREGKSGRTPLHIAIEMCNEVLANFLLEECQKLNLETATYAGLTAYQLAVILRNQQIQTDLKRKGAEPLTPPDSDNDSDIESDIEDSQMFDRFGDPGFFVHSHSGNKPINVA